MTPPKPPSRRDTASLWQQLRLFRHDILSSQPARLYRAWMAEFRTPFFRSYLCNDPALVNRILIERPDAFPKSNRIREGLNPLLGNSVFVTNGEIWKRQRRIIDPAFEGGRLRDTFPAMVAAGQAAVARLAPGVTEVEEQMSHAAADVIFRTLFSIPIEHAVATAVFHEFRTYQRTQPLLNLAAFLPLPRWLPRFHRRDTRRSAALIRDLIAQLCETRAAEIAAGTAPDDLATKIMTLPDPVTGRCFETVEMVDQVAIFFLAGHETSASALAWSLYLLATHPDWQDRLAAEAQAQLTDEQDFGQIGRLKIARAVFREALRLYPPVPMMVRETGCPVHLRDRVAPKGAQVVLSPWHLHRHERIWEQPDAFDPGRFDTENGKQGLRSAFIPFSAGPRVCPGAGFAMVEGPLLLAQLLRSYRVTALPDRIPQPVAHLTVRAKNGIWLTLKPRD